MKKLTRLQSQVLEQIILKFLDISSKEHCNLLSIGDASDKKIELWSEFYSYCDEHYLEDMLHGC